ncbi:MAG: sialidase family protein [Acidobacteriota bacterium]
MLSSWTLALLLAGASQGEGSPILSRGRIDDDPAHPRCHASTLVESPPGSNRLVAAWFGGSGEGKDDVGIWVSVRPPGGSWTPSVPVADGQRGDRRYPTWNPVLVHVHESAPLQLYYKVGPTPSSWWGERIESTDGGLRWSASERIPSPLLGPVRAKPVQLPSGRLVAGSSTEDDGWKIHFELSDDGGGTWRRARDVDHRRTNAAPFGAIQPTVLRHSDGRLQSLSRSQQNRIVESWSTDDGESWSPVRATTLPNPSAGVDALTLADGRHLLIYNHSERSRTARSKLNLAVTENGSDWQAVAVLEDQPGEYSYPAMVQTTDGMVHITYTYRRQRIQHVVIDPKELRAKPIVDGVWPELSGRR